MRSKDTIHQIEHVLRMKGGDTVVLFNGDGLDYECRIGRESEAARGDKSIFLEVVSSGRSRFMPKKRLYLCQSLIKKDNFEFISQKATEIGVTDIIPIVAEHSEKKSLNESRLTKIVVEASEQSGRGSIPVLHGSTGLDAIIDLLEKERVSPLAFHTEGTHFEAGKDMRSRGDLAIFIGPEGGWSPREVGLFHENDIPVFCLGAQVLRSETAAVASLTLVVFGNN